MLPYLFPHPPYAEDQPWARTILAVHCAHRGFGMGGLIGGALPVLRAPFRRLGRAIARKRATH